MSSAPDKTRQIKFTSSSVFRPIKRPTLSLSLLLVWQLWLAYLISFRSKFAVRNAFRAALAMASRRTITIKDGEKLRKMAASLQITLDELTYLENTRRAGVKQAAIPTAMALARINLVLQLAVERKLPKE